MIDSSADVVNEKKRLIVKGVALIRNVYKPSNNKHVIFRCVRICHDAQLLIGNQPSVSR
jgi:hypothetical protein